MIHKRMLSPARRALVDLMFETYYGSIENLIVRGGEPVLRPAPRVLKDVRLGRRESKRPVTNPKDFVLKTQHVDLFEHLDAMRDGVICRIDIQAGLPFRIRVPEAA